MSAIPPPFIHDLPRDHHQEILAKLPLSSLKCLRECCKAEVAAVNIFAVKYLPVLAKDYIEAELKEQEEHYNFLCEFWVTDYGFPRITAGYRRARDIYLLHASIQKSSVQNEQPLKILHDTLMQNPSYKKDLISFDQFKKNNLTPGRRWVPGLYKPSEKNPLWNLNHSWQLNPAGLLDLKVARTVCSDGSNIAMLINLKVMQSHFNSSEKPAK